jgi:NTE family protein
MTLEPANNPYKGLSSYTEDDASLFAGRDVDIERCAAVLADWNTRILILHGLTGCGKSSFLKAGVISYLEKGSGGISFARRGVSRDVFISCTADPLSKLANAIFEYTSDDVTIETPNGPRKLNLRTALPSEGNAAEFVRSVSGKPSLLLGVLEKLSRVIPETLVLIIDQAEEILALTNPARQVEARSTFFDFLSDFSIAQFDMRILISLRTEYLGRFVSHLRLGFWGSEVRDYYLSEMNTNQVREALLRPTNQYRFSIEQGVIETAIGQLDHAPLGRLGALQIAFAELYSLMKSRGLAVIGLSELEEVGNVEGSIERFVDKAIYDLGIASGLTPVNAEQELNTWKEALCDLIRYQPNGTVTSDIRSIAELQKRLANSRLNFEETTKVLLAQGLLKPINVVDGTGSLVRCYGIGHDTVGLVLWNWKVRREQQSRVSPVLSVRDEPEERPSSPGRDIALCLSGGGYRSMLFDLGALWRLNELGVFPQLGRVSSVAGGAVTAGVLAMSWKDLRFQNGVAINFHELVTSPLLELAKRSVDMPAALMGAVSGKMAATLLSRRLDKLLFGWRTLQDMPDEPMFVFNSTNLTNGSLFRFSKFYIGDEDIGPIRYPYVKLAVVIAASNALPPLLSPLVLNLKGVTPEELPFGKAVYLATGSLIDNLAMDAAWSHHRTVLICDGGVDSPADPAPGVNILRQTVRSIQVIDHQLRQSRRRQVAEAFRLQIKKGACWSIQNASDYETGFDPKRASELVALPTRFKRMDRTDSRDLVKLGYALCDAVVTSTIGRKDRTERLNLPYF